MRTAVVPAWAFAPVVVLAVAFVGFCCRENARSRVRYLPRTVSALTCLLSEPFGGIVRLLVGQDPR